MDKMSAKRDSAFWKYHRIETLSEQEKVTYRVVDSIGKENHFDKILSSVEKLADFKIGIGIFDLDLGKTIVYNKYEGYRLGLGLYTNEKLFENVSIGGFAGYGLRDNKWKYGGEIIYTISKENEFKIGTKYQNNLMEVGNYGLNANMQNLLNFRNFQGYLMDNINNNIRNTVRDFAKANGFSFYDIRQHTGWLRNIIIRYCSTGELMVNICINHEAEEDRKLLLDHLLREVPAISTLLYTINPKWNDSIYDLEPQTYFGKGYAIEKLKAGADEEYQFIISPKSFFQTNTKQAEKLYSITRDFAGLTGNEIVYDLYCGTGSIGIFISRHAKKIIGVEVIEDAIEDAKKNAALNNIKHAEFFAGDVIKICNDEFFATHGRPDVVITDPPRAGMHEKLVLKLLEMEAPKIVYVSCNTATQARDLLLLQEKYKVEKVQPVDMFPHTHHIESVALLTLK
ncbi:MAG: 23S rRNA (uracil(1939)-C(5))-methyltransferase RlmD [Sphingobacteriales bacterium]|nr:MAG: 23S rRNA (uracil(1939)-C(5))-methyltransferase RlmD [Sphingobacteriales bacterium]